MLCNELAELRVAVPKSIDSNASSKVQISSVLNVPHVASLAPDEHERRAGVGLHHELFVFADQRRGDGIRGRVRVRQLGLSLYTDPSVNFSLDA